MPFAWFEQAQVWMRQSTDLPAFAADAAEVTRGWRMDAVKRLSKANRQGPPPDTFRANKQVSMAQFFAARMGLEQSHRPIMSVDVPIHG